jgi:hypothetical protein
MESLHVRLGSIVRLHTKGYEVWPLPPAANYDPPLANPRLANAPQRRNQIQSPGYPRPGPLVFS